jgi:hypothetical protein
MFVRFSCGCIGLKTNHSQAEYDQHGNSGRVTPEIVFKVCDGDGDGNITSHYRPLGEKSSTPIPLVEEISLIRQLGDLIGDGYRHREMKRLLK